LANFEVVIYVDDDDEKTRDDCLSSEYPLMRLRVVRGTRFSPISPVYNLLLKESHGSIIGYWGDDAVIQTSFWDRIVIQEFQSVPDRILLLYPPDTKPERDFALHGFVSRRSTEIVGDLFPSHFDGQCDDRWLTEVYKRIGRAKVSKIRVNHQRVAESRDMYRKKDRIWRKSVELYRTDALKRERDVWVEKLKSAIEVAS
jgi:hypothetical protein